MVFSPNVALWYYKLMIIMLYNEDIPGLIRDSDRVTMDIKELSRYLGQRVYRMRSCLGELEKLGIVYDLQMSEHAAQFKILTPQNYKLDKPTIM